MKTKVAIVKCRDYERIGVEQAVKKAFDLLGGIGIFIKKGEKVLIKPNILSARLPEDGICTHIEVIRAVVKSVRDCGALPCIGDNPGGSLSPAKAYEGSGLMSLAKEVGVELKETKGIKIVNDIPIANYFFECDKIISLPKMKTHILMGLTGAIKNMYGAVAGLHKSELHKKFPSPEEFVKVLIDTFKIVKPNLVLMDGIIAMDQDGPSSGRLRNPGLLIAGEDSVAIDAVFAELAGIKPLSVFTTKEAYIRKLGEADLENIEILGESVKENLINDFEVPGKYGLIAILGPCAKFVARFIRFEPYIDKRLCKKCMICQDSCPVLAITINPDFIPPAFLRKQEEGIKSARRADRLNPIGFNLARRGNPKQISKAKFGINPKNSTIDLKKCIKCMCCHEVCPHKAIELKRNFLAKVFGL